MFQTNITFLGCYICKIINFYLVSTVKYDSRISCEIKKLLDQMPLNFIWSSLLKMADVLLRTCELGFPHFLIRLVCISLEHRSTCLCCQASFFDYQYATMLSLFLRSDFLLNKLHISANFGTLGTDNQNKKQNSVYNNIVMIECHK